MRVIRRLRSEQVPVIEQRSMGAARKKERKKETKLEELSINVVNDNSLVPAPLIVLPLNFLERQIAKTKTRAQ